MNWKELLKPNWKKILVLIIVLHFLFGFMSFYLIAGGTFVNDPLWQITFLLEGAGWLIMGNLFVSSIFGLIFMIGVILVVYLFSCLIIWIFYKLKKK